MPFILYFSLLLITTISFGQNRKSQSVNLESMDVYTLKFNLIKEGSKVKYINCATGQKFKAMLFYIKVEEIIHCSDTSVYNFPELSKIQYALFHQKPKGDEVIGTFYNSDNKECLIFNRSLPKDITPNNKFFQHAIVTRISPCNNNKKRVSKAINLFKQENSK